MLRRRSALSECICVVLADNHVDFNNFSLLTLPGPSRPPAKPGTAVVFEPCAPGSQPLSSHQGWVLNPESEMIAGRSDDYAAVHTLRPSAEQTLCLDWSDATQMRTQPCAQDAAAALNQKWNISEINGDLKGKSGAFVRAVGMTGCDSGSGGSPLGGCCLEVSGDLGAPGTPADIYSCEANGGVPCAKFNEVFTMVEQDAIMRMVAGSTGFCLTTS